jgi:hypothetical protein
VRWTDETPTTDGLRAEVESLSGGIVSLDGGVIVGKGRTRATLHGGELVFVSTTLHGDSEAALVRLREIVMEKIASP